MPRLRFAILGAGLLGAVLPIASQISAVLGDRIFSSRLASVYLWPSSIWLLATDGHEYEPGAYLVVVFSALANILLYALLATLVRLLIRFIQRVATHSP